MSVLSANNLQVPEVSTHDDVPTPAAGQFRLYIYAGALYLKDSSGTPTEVGNSGGGSLDAAFVTYAPVTPSDWDTPPDDAAEALDELAGRVEGIENAGGGGGSISVTDGTTTVSPVTLLNFTNSQVDDNGAGEVGIRALPQSTDIYYAASYPADWSDPVPENVTDALDVLAAREGSGGSSSSMTPRLFAMYDYAYVPGTNESVPAPVAFDDTWFPQIINVGELHDNNIGERHKLKAPVNGIYELTGFYSVSLDTVPTSGNISFGVIHNATSLSPFFRVDYAGETSHIDGIAFAVKVYLTAGDYLSIEVQNADSGENIFNIHFQWHLVQEVTIT